MSRGTLSGPCTTVKGVDWCFGGKVVDACRGGNTHTRTSGAVPLDWQIRVLVPLFKEGDQRLCSNHRGITLLSLPGKIYSGVLERRVCRIVKPRIQKEHGFHPGHA